MRIHFATKSYRDGIDISEQDFYAKLAEAEELPTTSQPSAGEFLDAYKEAARMGQGVLCVTISSQLSGTYTSAITARDMFRDAPIRVIDSKSTAMGLALMLMAAQERIEQGASLEEVAALVEDLVHRIRVYFVVDTLKYLQKGGRIGGAAALLGSVLQMKPVLMLENGRVEPYERVRTRAKAIERMLETLTVHAKSHGHLHVCVGHAQAPDEAEAVARYINQHFPHADLTMSAIPAVIGVHTGPGCVGIGFYTE
jgi:DegV family protein with EDD domain